MSRALGVSKQAWSTYAKEMLAIIVAVKLWRPYLLGHKFYIQIDKRSLKYLLEQRFSTLKQHKWVLKLFGYDYEIVYKPGKENRPSMHFLGGMPTQPSMPSPYHKLSYGMISTNPYVQKVDKLVIENPGQPYSKKGSWLYFKQWIVISPQSNIMQQLLHEFHNSPNGGHLGIHGTFKWLAQQFLAIYAQVYLRLCLIVWQMSKRKIRYTHST